MNCVHLSHVRTLCRAWLTECCPKCCLLLAGECRYPCLPLWPEGLPHGVRDTLPECQQLRTLVLQDVLSKQLERAASQAEQECQA